MLEPKVDVLNAAESVCHFYDPTWVCLKIGYPYGTPKVNG